MTRKKIMVAASRLGAGLALLWMAATPAQAETCDEIRARIGAKIRASGVSAFTLTIVDSEAPAIGRTVGNCDRGTKKIVYLQQGKATPAREASPVITECRDGSVSVGGDCRKSGR